MFNDYVRDKSRRFYESKHGTTLKILSPKQIVHRLPIALLQVKSGNNSERLLNEITQIVYFLYQSKELLKEYIIT